MSTDYGRKSLSVATTRGYCDVLKTVVPPQNEVLDENVPNNKAKVKGRKENGKANNALILACSSAIGFTIVDESMTKYFSGGDAELTRRELRKRFEPDTSETKFKLKRNSSKLSSWTNDLEVWISRLNVIRTRLKTISNELSNKDVIIHILKKFPEEYNMMVEAMERKFDDLVHPLT